VYGDWGLVGPVYCIIDRLLGEPLEGLLEVVMVLPRPAVLCVIAKVDGDICPSGVLVEEGEGTHRRNVRVLLRDPGGSIGVEVGAAELLEEGPELLRHSDIGNTVDLLQLAIIGLKVIGLTRLATDAKVARNVQQETHEGWRDLGLQGRAASIFLNIRA
jgi:hypothetical protein